MRYGAITERMTGLGGDKWALHAQARRMRAEGAPVIELTIGEPDQALPAALSQAIGQALAAGRTGYSNGRGEPALLAALAARYAARAGRPVGTDQVIALPGTQTALFVALQALCDPGTEVITGDPMYATYEAVIAAAGAGAVPVALRPERGFRLDAADVAAAVTPRTRVILLNSPHNPTGAVLTATDLAALGEVARAHDLWILSDEVYEDIVFPGTTFLSPFDVDALAERVVVASSISKSHAAPGLRSGWLVGPAEFCHRILPVAEAMLFGNQPFIADATTLALAEPSPVAGPMAANFARRSALVAKALDGVAGLRVHQPQAGMFALLDVRAFGLSGQAFAEGLLKAQFVAVMPGESFGQGLAGWCRISLTVEDGLLAEACARIAAHAAELGGTA